MGVSITELVEARQIELESLSGKAIAIDAYNMMYQFLSSIRDRMTGEPLRDSKGRITSHLSGLFYRTARMIEVGIIPVYVFDGKPPDFKDETIAQRREIKEEAREKWKEALETGDTEAVRRYSMASSKLTDEMVVEAKKLLSLMGVSSVQAPSEGEAQATHLLRQSKVWAVGSQDWDSLLFGSDRLVKNLGITGRRKIPRKESYIIVKPELIELSKVLSTLGITREQLIIMGILIGTDYNMGGVKGLGPKKALQLVKEQKTLDAVMKHVGWEFRTPPQKIFDFFMNPPAEDIEIKQEKLDAGELERMLIEEHDFSRERIDSSLKKLRACQEKGKQTGLGSFLG
jgi:flap endonuclease-1